MDAKSVNGMSQSNPLEEAVDLLNAAATLSAKVTSPIITVNDDLQKVNSYIDNIENSIKSLNDSVSTARDLGDACFAFTEIPAIGEVLDALGQALRDYAGTVNKSLKPINDFKKDILDKVKSVIQDVCDLCRKIDGYVTYFATK